jgi:phthalate 4,5-dioxygenase reductase subunit
MVHRIVIPLKLASARCIARDIHEMEFRDPRDAALPAFSAGAHLTLRTPGGFLRKYSLCNDPAENDRYVIAVKREASGRGGSVDLVDHAEAGDLIEVSPPENAFPLAPGAKGYIFIAGGIGITPIMSMIRHIESIHPVKFNLYYLTRDKPSTAFLDELSGAGLRTKVKIHHDDGDPSRAFDLWTVLEKPGSSHIYCCGPRALMDSVRDMAGHWPRSQVHFESFLDAEQTRKADNKAFRLRLARSNALIEVAAGQSIIQAMREHGIEAPTSCESGTCGTCKTTLLAGEADHRDLVLMDEEQATRIMICVSRAKSDELVIDL